MSDIKKWMTIIEDAQSSNGITVNLTLNVDTKGNSTLSQNNVDNMAKVPNIQASNTESLPSEITTSKKEIVRGGFEENDTVSILPRAGGGVGRFINYTKNGAIIDIKGNLRELKLDDFSDVKTDHEDPYENGNNWYHQSTEPDTIGSLKDKPEFRPGDIVRVNDVYGSAIGPGYGIFIAYSTNGKESIISFDDREIVVPTTNLEAVLEQNAKDEFSQMDNDGALSPMSLGSDNVKIEQPSSGMSIKESEMDQRDEFSKWISTVEEALRTEGKVTENFPVQNQSTQKQCGCGNWDCQSCFPEPGVGPGEEQGLMSFGPNEPMGPVVGETDGVCPTCGHQCDGHGGDFDDNEEFEVVPVEGQSDEFDIEFEEGDSVDDFLNAGGKITKLPYMNKPRNPGQSLGSKHIGSASGRDTTIGQLRGKQANVSVPGGRLMKPVVDTEESGSAGGMGSGGMGQVEEEPEHFIEKPKSGKGVKLGDITQKTEFKPSGGENSPLTHGEDNLDEEPGYDREPDFKNPEWAGQDVGFGASGDDSEYNPEKASMIAAIESMQGIGASMDDQYYSPETLNTMSMEELAEVHARVLGHVSNEQPAESSQMSQAQDELQADEEMPILGESMPVVIDRPSLMERLRWDDEIREAFSMIDEEELDESSLSRLIGKEHGGQKLVQWLHRRHKLSNEADLQPAPFNERLLWKEFKANPDNFIIVAGSDGVAGIKPYKKYIDDRTAAFAKKGKTYNPGGDSTLPYQIIAFTDDGTQVDPALLQPKKDDNDEEPDLDKYSDPTVMKARMGLHHGKDMQNPDNVFNLLADQIGTLQTVFVTKGPGVERDKMAKRSQREPIMASDQAMKQIFNRIRPILKKLGDQAMGQINRTAQRYITGGNFEAAQKIAKTGQRLKQFLITLDTTGDIGLNTNYGSSTRGLSEIIKSSLVKASGSREGTPEYNQWLNDAAKGNTVALKPVLDAIRDNLVELA